MGYTNACLRVKPGSCGRLLFLPVFLNSLAFEHLGSLQPQDAAGVWPNNVSPKPPALDGCSMAVNLSVSMPCGTKSSLQPAADVMLRQLPVLPGLCTLANCWATTGSPRLDVIS